MMKLKVLCSSSAGNCYILSNDNEALIIEAGVNFKAVKEALNFNLTKVVGCIITHEHKDHCKAVKDVTAAGINVYASNGTCKAFGIESHRLTPIKSGASFTIGGFRIKGFDSKHDCAEPFNFLIEHKETGRFVFLTDTYYCSYIFPGLNNIIVEANYSEDILQGRLESGEEPAFLRDRVLESHMSLQTCKNFLLANDLSEVNNIVLIHLSDRNSDANRFKSEVEAVTGKYVTIAGKGVEIGFSKSPF